ncbi:galectin-3b [Rhincodon typus]|uniref:galectin-3b n=1 Tax=Rhincodon typus TaxID=259920 RepID=UPI0009A2B0D8|nr:galectin-3b [Rhincodon typus]XP_048455745.1 galectin-3b [Rhincodon typus]XP_048455746.1 galectin-3b [Rhincodon typus]
MEELSLEDALGPDFSNANKLHSGGVNPQPGWPAPQPGWPAPQPGWPAPQPGTWPGQEGPYAPPMPAPFGSPGAPNQPGQGGTALPVPYDLPIPGGWQPQRMVKIVGTVKMNAEKFVIDVYSGQDIVFHFSARFREAGFHQVMVRNCRIGNAWGGEERDAPKFPFKYGERFEVLILGEPNQYKVAVNNQHLLEFQHRYKTLQDVTKVSIYGEIDLHAVFVM